MNCFDIMKEKIVDYKKDLEQKLREAFADMKREERVEVLNNVLNHLLALDFVQQMEYRLREVQLPHLRLPARPRAAVS